jgi:heterotetrameric sarcosine oxidase gamma subunit
VSAPEGTQQSAPDEGVRLATCAADVIELAALRGRAGNLAEVAAARGVALPERGRTCATANGLALAVRPDRWLLVTPPLAPGAAAAAWERPCAGCAAAVDLSSALTVLHVAGAAVREMLTRGCRLDLDPRAFPAGHAAATPMVQVQVILAALPSGFLLLTPSTTARHLREWLEGAARPFGLGLRGNVTVTDLSGDEFT